MNVISIYVIQINSHGPYNYLNFFANVYIIILS